MLGIVHAASLPGQTMRHGVCCWCREMDSVQSLMSSRGAISPSKAPPDRLNSMRASDDGVQAPRHPSADVLRQAAVGGYQALCIDSACSKCHMQELVLVPICFCHYQESNGKQCSWGSSLFVAHESISQYSHLTRGLQAGACCLLSAACRTAPASSNLCSSQ